MSGTISLRLDQLFGVLHLEFLHLLLLQLQKSSSTLMRRGPRSGLSGSLDVSLASTRQSDQHQASSRLEARLLREADVIVRAPLVHTMSTCPPP